MQRLCGAMDKSGKEPAYSGDFDGARLLLAVRA
jgi:hypothetical protein